MFRAIFFDLGNVILPFDPGILARSIASRSRYPAEEILRLLWHPELGASFETGRISPKEFFEEVRKTCGLTLEFEEFLRAFNEIFWEDGEVVRLLGLLKGRYPLGLISNTNAAHMEHIRKTFSFLPYIDEFILSHEVGLRKPDPAIYRHALERFGVAPDQTLFIDDVHENVKAARELGITAIRFESAGRLAESLADLGVIPAQGNGR